eukprot:scaffold33345_cov21-Tisochrysis_lutea.AAC.1
MQGSGHPCHSKPAHHGDLTAITPMCENHMPEVVVIDEIGTEAECAAARTIAQRGRAPKLGFVQKNFTRMHTCNACRHCAWKRARKCDEGAPVVQSGHACTGPAVSLPILIHFRAKFRQLIFHPLKLLAAWRTIAFVPLAVVHKGSSRPFRFHVPVVGCTAHQHHQGGGFFGPFYDTRTRISTSQASA